jgi:hypothetical protein
MKNKIIQEIDNNLKGTRLSGTIFEGRKLNNPDSKNMGYIAVHGIVKSKLSEVRSGYSGNRRSGNAEINYFNFRKR